MSRLDLTTLPLFATLAAACGAGRRFTLTSDPEGGSSSIFYLARGADFRGLLDWIEARMRAELGHTKPLLD